MPHCLMIAPTKPLQKRSVEFPFSIDHLDLDAIFDSDGDVWQDYCTIRDGAKDHLSNLVEEGLCALEVPEGTMTKILSPSLEGEGWRVSILRNSVPVAHREGLCLEEAFKDLWEWLCHGTCCQGLFF